MDTLEHTSTEQSIELTGQNVNHVLIAAEHLDFVFAEVMTLCKSHCKQHLLYPHRHRLYIHAIYAHVNQSVIIFFSL